MLGTSQRLWSAPLEEPVQASGHRAYRRIQAETASSGELVALMYDALANDLHRAERALGVREREEAHEALVRAQDIVLELVVSLDMDAGELAGQLSALYQYMHRRLIDANVRQDATPVREVAGLLQPVRAAWLQVVRGDGPSGHVPGALSV
jgi:flagellar secretion chaperone FliS